MKSDKYQQAVTAFLDKDNAEKKQKRSVANRIVDLLLDLDIELFLDIEQSEPYISFPHEPFVAHPIGGTVFRNKLSAIYWETAKNGISESVHKQVVATLSGKAHSEKITYKLWNRVAQHENEIYYDIADNLNVVKITGLGWSIEQTAPVKFRRYPHQAIQVVPVKQGNLRAFLKYLNIRNPDEQLLALTYFPVACIPDIPRCAIACIGEQGTAKTGGLRKIQELIDPTTGDLLHPPQKPGDLFALAAGYYCLYLDNVSHVTSDESDAFCRIVTGGTNGQRKLYTDNDIVQASHKRLLGFTSINQIIQKQDLLERSILLHFEYIPDESRKPEEQINQEFLAEKPLIMGGLFDALSFAIGNKVTSTSGLPRMADYAQYAASAAKYLGESEDGFLGLLSATFDKQKQTGLQSSVLGQVILDFMANKSEYSGRITEVRQELVEYAERSKGITQYDLPSHLKLTQKINELIPALRQKGIGVTTFEKGSGSHIRLFWTDGQPKMAVVAEEVFK